MIFRAKTVWLIKSHKFDRSQFTIITFQMPSKHICKFAKHPNILVYLLLFVFLWKIIAYIKIAFKLNHLTTQNNFILKIQWNIFVFVCSINERRRFFIHCFFNSKKTINTFDSHMESCTILNDINNSFFCKKG